MSPTTTYRLVTNADGTVTISTKSRGKSSWTVLAVSRRRLCEVGR